MHIKFFTSPYTIIKSFFRKQEIKYLNNFTLVLYSAFYYTLFQLVVNNTASHKTETGETLNGKTETEHTLNKIPGH